MRDVLTCTVRGCGLPLRVRERAAACGAGHAFDRGRSGYLNLLQPQDRRSPEAGDTKQAVDARTRLFGAGIGTHLVENVLRAAATLELRRDDVVVDLGCGPGALLASLSAEVPVDGYGLDLSVPAVDSAARRHPDLTWVVTNVDRGLPLRGGAARLVLSVHARRHPSGCARVLSPGGRLIVAVPAADDLIELRAAIAGAMRRRDRAETVVAEHAPFFAATARATARERRRLPPEALRDVLATTYRGARHTEAARVRTLGAMEVTFASEIIVFERRGGPSHEP